MINHDSDLRIIDFLRLYDEAEVKFVKGSGRLGKGIFLYTSRDIPSHRQVRTQQPVLGLLFRGDSNWKGDYISPHEIQMRARECLKNMQS